MTNTYKEIAQAFLNELQQAAAGQTTSLPFIRHEYSPLSEVQEDEIFQVLVVGGSIYKSAMVQKVEGRLYVLSQMGGTLPVFLTAEQFLEFCVEQVDKHTRVLAINMAFPLTPSFVDGRLEGHLAFATKEHTFEGLIGEPIAQRIVQAVREARGQEIVAAVANDTICLLLSGLTRMKWDQVAAGIVGTGMNFALFLEENTLVNLESANFSGFELSPEAKLVDAASSQPGKGVFEKEVAGAYLHQVFNTGLRLRGIEHPEIENTQQIDAIAMNGTGEAQKWADEVLERSASLVAAHIAAVTMFLDRPTSFVMEGSLFWKGYRYRERVLRVVSELVPKYDVLYVNVPDSGILGGGKLLG